MKQYCLIFGAFFIFLWSCKPSEKKDALPSLMELEIVDSSIVSNDPFFMKATDQVTLIGDSLLAISSIRTPAVGVFRKNGEQIGYIASGDFPIGAFMPAAFDISGYPIIYILDGNSQSILVFNVDSQKFIEKLRLKLPEDKIIRTIGAKFKKIENGFLVELYSQKHDAYLPEHYRDSGNLLYTFDNNGNIINSILEYPEVYKNQQGSISPINYFTMGDGGNSVLISFPHDKNLYRYSLNGKRIDQIHLPPSRSFDYQLRAAERIIDFNKIMSGEEKNSKTPDNHYFNSIHEGKNNIYIETWMKIGEGGIKTTRFSHLMVYNKKEEKWHETSNPRNILDIGMLAGVVNDTLYFYEGSLMKQDEKHIKRAVLKPIKD